MAMTVAYTNFAGSLVYENRSGTESYYVADTLGSTAALLDQNGNKTDSWTYWPYGEVQTRTGSNVTPFGFVGTYGVFQDILNDLTYIEARFLRIALARWQNVEKFWPLYSAYGYATNNPITRKDVTGLDPIGGAVACAIGGIAGGVVSRLGGEDSPAKTACIAAADCLAAGALGLLADEDPSVLQCAIGAGAAAIQNYLEDLCDDLTKDKTCTPPPGRGKAEPGGGEPGGGESGPKDVCHKVAILVGTLTACLGAGSELTDYLIQSVLALLGSECEGYGKSITPG